MKTKTFILRVLVVVRDIILLIIILILIIKIKISMLVKNQNASYKINYTKI